MKICFVVSSEQRELFAAPEYFPGPLENARWCREQGHEVTILFADSASETSEVTRLSWRRFGFAVHSLAAGQFLRNEDFYPKSLRNSWLTYRWLRLHPFDRIIFNDDSSAGLIAFAAARLGEAFDATRLIYQIDGPDVWGIHLRERRQLVRDDLVLPYSVQYSVENADQVLMPVDYFAQRIRESGWQPAGRLSVFPYLEEAQDESLPPTKKNRGESLVYPVHDSDHAPLSVFLTALARTGRGPRVLFLCFGALKHRQGVWKRVRAAIAAAGVDPASCKLIEKELPAHSLWIFSSLWLNAPFLVLRAANRGWPLLLADTPEARQIPALGSFLVKWTLSGLQACLENIELIDVAREAPSRTALGEEWTAAVLEGGPVFLRGEEAKDLSAIRVSVCVAHFNKAENLVEALQSLREQTHRNLEVIVVDDGSDDPASQEAFKSATLAFASEDWKFVRERENHGPAHARNLAAELAGGSYLIFFDADDVAFPDMVERLLKGLVRSQGACVAGSSRRLQKEDGKWRPEGISTYVGGSLENAFLNTPAGAVFIVPREVFITVGGFKTESPLDCHEDWNFHLRLMAREYRIHILPEPVFAYRSSNLSRSFQVSQNMALLMEPLLEGTPLMRKKVLHFALERAGALESAVRMLADYQEVAREIRWLRVLRRIRRSLVKVFERNRRG